jgi:thymidylate synthase (FAD)
MTERKIENVLDYGFVELVDHMGSDLTVVNAARVSFGKRKEVMDASDEKLIKYLVEHQHRSPLRHVQLQLHIKTVEYLARQIIKHQIGSEFSIGSKGAGFNEISGRYVNAETFDYYTPNGFRKQSSNNKQASTDEIVGNSEQLEAEYRQHVDQAFMLYSKLVASGVAKEQARGVIPLCFYTEFYWTISLEAAVNFIKLRKHDGSQYEIRLIADALERIVATIAPITMKYLLEYENT